MNTRAPGFNADDEPWNPYGDEPTQTPMREPEEHEDNEDISLVNAVFVADKLLVRLSGMDLSVTDPRILSDALTALSQLATAQASVRQAEAQDRIATHLGNIHQCLMAPDANREPTGVADQLKRVADALYAPGIDGVTRSIAENIDSLGTWAAMHT